MSAWDSVVSQIFDCPAMQPAPLPRVPRGTMEWRVIFLMNRIGKANTNRVIDAIGWGDEKRSAAVRNAINRLATKGYLQHDGYEIIRTTPTPLQRTVWVPIRAPFY